MKKTIIAISVLAMLVISGCANRGNENQFIDDVGSDTRGEVSTYIVIDKDTGCRYVLFNWNRGGGASPLLDIEGEAVCKPIVPE